jgi:hypothetical protein
MKKFAAIVGIMMSSSLFSLPVTNIADPSLLKEGIFFEGKCNCFALKLGYLGNFVQNRKVEDITGDINSFGYQSNCGKLTFNAWDLLDIYGYIGTYNYTYKDSRIDFLETKDYFVNAKSQDQLIWGLGTKAILWKHNFGCWGSTYVGIDAKYQIMKPTAFQSVQIDNIAANTNNTSYHAREAQVAMGVAHKIGFVVPYAALKWSYFKAKPNTHAYIQSATALDPKIPIYQLENYTHFGFALGVTLLAKEKISLNGEVLLNDENAFSVNCEVRF